MRRLLTRSALALALVAGTALAAGAPAGPDSMPASGSSSMGGMAMGAATAQDSQFVKEASGGGMAEVELGKLAASQGHSSQVRQFGQRMIHDHSQANQKLASIANAKGMMVSQQPPPMEEATASRLRSLTGAAFDQAYAQKMVEDHNKDIALFRQEAQHGNDADLRQFASTTLPTLEEHLRLAQALPGANSGSTGGTHSP